MIPADLNPQWAAGYSAGLSEGYENGFDDGFADGANDCAPDFTAAAESALKALTMPIYPEAEAQAAIAALRACLTTAYRRTTP